MRQKTDEAVQKWYHARAEELRAMNIDPETAWVAMREVMSGFDLPKTISMSLKNPNGEEAKGPKEKVAECVRHFTEVYNNRKVIDPEIFEELANLATFEKVLELGEAPTWEEVAHAIRKLKCGKSPGPSGVSPDALKALDAEGIATLHAFIVLFWNGDNDGDFDSWRQMTLTILPKAGKKSYTTLNSW